MNLLALLYDYIKELAPVAMLYAGYLHTKVHAQDKQLMKKVTREELDAYIDLKTRPFDVKLDDLKGDLREVKEDIRETRQDIKKLLDKSVVK